LYFDGGVADGDSEADAAHHSEIGKIVSQVGDFGFLHAGLFQNFFVSGNFVRLLFINKVHSHFGGAFADRGAFASADDAGADSRGAREGQALAVVRVEGLQFEGGTVRLGKKIDVTHGDGAVHVHEENLDGASAFGDGGGNFEF